MERNADRLYSCPFLVLQLFLLYIWFLFLSHSDSYYSVYILCGGLGLVALLSNYREKPALERRQRRIVAVASVLFAAAVFLANLAVLRALVRDTVRTVFAIWLYLEAFLVFLGSMSVCRNTLIFCFRLLRARRDEPKLPTKTQLRRFSLLSMLLLCAADLLVFLPSMYPGVVSVDSADQISQILSGVYSNHHPFWHTMIIRFFLSIGMGLFHDLNAGIALYSLFQILFMAAVISYSLSTLYRSGVPLGAVLVFLLWFALLPIHLAYSFTMWKDIPFAGCVLLFVVSLYRILKKLDVSAREWILLALGSLGFCLLRSNGYFAFVLVTLVFALLFGKQQRRMLLLFLAVLALGFVMKRPVLKALDVRQPDFVESLSVPLQQIARTVADGKELTAEEQALLGEIIEVEQIPALYDSGLSNPIKDAIRNFGNQDYLVSHKGAYLKLWLGLLRRYPLEFIEAWAEQTKGYWHGGYDYWVWTTGVEPNDFGGRQTIFSLAAFYLYFVYQDVFTFDLFQPLLSIGLHFWIVCAAFCLNLMRRRRVESFLALPVFAITLSLMIASPVFSETRYDYALFTAFPFLLLTAVYGKDGGRADPAPAP